MRKANEPQKPRQQIYTPREFSRIKYERQLQREEHLKAARLQFMQQQKVKKIRPTSMRIYANS